MEGRLESVRHNTHVHVVCCWLAGWQLHTQALPTGEVNMQPSYTHSGLFPERSTQECCCGTTLDSLGLVAEGDGGVLIFLLPKPCAFGARRLAALVLSYLIAWSG